MLAVSYGGGTNSTAMLVGLKERGIRPDVITFADTGGEKPATYEHVHMMQGWCDANNFPPIVVVKKVRRNGDILTLEQNCLEQNMLPSIAYGFKSCSQKYKIAPQDKFFNNHKPARKWWKGGKKITKLIGYDAGEERRARIASDDKYIYEYPLIEWGWGRSECIEAIKREGIPLPGKSACFFCPSSKSTEIRWLAAAHPDLMARAIAMEEGANLTQVKGLGRSFAWKDLIATDDMFAESYIDLACGCYDG